MKGIYLISNKVNGKKYVGLSSNINRRFAEHKTPKNIANKKTILSKAFRKYRIENFEFEILEFVDNVDCLADREMYWIEKLQPEYNMNKGGNGNLGRSVSDEMKSILRLAGKLQWESKTYSQKQNIISNNLKGPRVGHSVSLETRKKLRDFNLGRTLTDDVKNKISSANKISMVGNRNGNKKVIVCDDESELTFDSIIEAAKHLNCHPSNITKVLKGKQKSCKGYFFKYGV